MRKEKILEILENAKDGNGEWEPDHVILKREIVAWMPLPEPYKEGGAG